TPATAIHNLFLAGDYVQNDMDLATMEGANETARRAVNAILEQDRSSAPPCFVGDGHLARNEPAWLKALKDLDDRFYPFDIPHALLGVEEELTAPLLWGWRKIEEAEVWRRVEEMEQRLQRAVERVVD